MISLIVCSVNPDMYEEFSENVNKTIGVEHEIIRFDNREKKWGICKVYNHCFEKAKFPYICFVHEDMFFFTTDWGKILIDFHSKNPKCGVIGFAGSTFVNNTFVQWKIDKRISKVHTFLSYQKDLPVDNNNLRSFFNCKNDFDPVLVLDGMFLFTSRQVCNDVKFDELMLDNFHIYDTDFTFTVSLKYNNYVCSQIDNMHRCKSSFSNEYINGLLAFHKKRNHYLPHTIVNLNPIHLWLIKNHEILDFSYTLKRNCISGKEYKDMMKIFCMKYRVNVFFRFIDFVYGKVMNVKIRKINLS